MAYAQTGLGFSFSWSAALAPPRPKKATPEPLCVSKAEQDQAKTLCRFGIACATANKPVCGTTMPVIVAPVGPSEPAPPPKKTPITSGTRTKLPVQSAVPAPVLPPVELRPPPAPGVPIWVWIAGGVAVLGTGAFLYSRKKGS